MSQISDLAKNDQRRKAVGKGLRCLPLDKTQLEKALALWDHLFESGNPGAIALYVDTLAALLRLSDRDKHTARLAILREMITASLDPIPSPREHLPIPDSIIEGLTG